MLKSYGVISSGQNLEFITVSSLRFPGSPNTLSISCNDNFSEGLRASWVGIHHAFPLHLADPHLVASVSSASICCDGVSSSSHSEAPEKGDPASVFDKLFEEKQD